MTIVIIGGGAAGFFAALAAKETNPAASVILLEKSSQLLSKVRISGGGRCNVTHSCFVPRELTQNYPRGTRELLGPFNRFQPTDTIQWFESRGVALKTEEDGRMFPTTDSSSTIIDCLTTEARKKKVDVRLRTSIASVTKYEDGFLLEINDGETLRCEAILLASGSHPSGYKIAQSLGHTINSPVPSLFTFNVPSSPLKDLSGIVVEEVNIRLDGSDFKQSGPLLITHWGFSGPAALKLSAWGARFLHERQYQAAIEIDWAPAFSLEQLQQTFKELRQKSPAQTLNTNNPCKLPKNLWKKFVEQTGLQDKRLSEIGNDGLSNFCKKIKGDIYKVEGKTTNKEEFVTCGGVCLSEVNFKTMESKLCPGLYFAGEVLDIDAVTGGFNFQNAWTTGYIAGTAMGSL